MSRLFGGDGGGRVGGVENLLYVSCMGDPRVSVAPGGDRAGGLVVFRISSGS